MYLEVISLDHLALHVVLYLSQHCKHGDVGLAGSSGSCNEEVLASEVGHLKYNGLNTIESFGTCERKIRKFIGFLLPQILFKP